MTGSNDGPLAVAWRALSRAPADAQWRHIAVSALKGAALHAGMRFPDRMEALIIAFPGRAVPAAGSLPKAAGFECRPFEAEIDGHGQGSTLAIIRTPEGEPSMFDLMASDLLDQVSVGHDRSPGEQLACVLDRLHEWRAFMSAAGRRPLSPERQTGLLAELLFLGWLLDLRAGIDRTVRSWVGPLRAVQDFHLGSHAVEVKGHVGPDGFPAKISGLRQLDHAGGPLHLVAIRLREAEVGLALPETVASLRERTAFAFARKLLDARLVCSGYLDEHAMLYGRRLEIADTRVWEVTPPFPRLIAGDLHASILEARYVLDLDRIDLRHLPLDTLLALLPPEDSWT